MPSQMNLRRRSCTRPEEEEDKTKKIPHSCCSTPRPAAPAADAQKDNFHCTHCTGGGGVDKDQLDCGTKYYYTFAERVFNEPRFSPTTDYTCTTNVDSHISSSIDNLKWCNHSLSSVPEHDDDDVDIDFNLLFEENNWTGLEPDETQQMEFEITQEFSNHDVGRSFTTTNIIMPESEPALPLKLPRSMKPQQMEQNDVLLLPASKKMRGSEALKNCTATAANTTLEQNNHITQEMDFKFSHNVSYNNVGHSGMANNMMMDFEPLALEVLAFPLEPQQVQRDKRRPPLPTISTSTITTALDYSVTTGIFDYHYSLDPYSIPQHTKHLLYRMRRTNHSHEKVRKCKKKMKELEFMDKDVVQELMYCMQDTKKSRARLKKMLLEIMHDKTNSVFTS